MVDKDKEKRDLESGDNPAEREKLSGNQNKKEDTKEKEQRDLESGDNPEERERTTGK